MARPTSTAASAASSATAPAPSRPEQRTPRSPAEPTEPRTSPAPTDFVTPGLHIALTLPADLGPRRSDVQAASRALVGELQTLTAAWLDPRRDWSGPLRRYTTGSAADDDISSVAFYRDRGHHMVGHLSVAISLGQVATDTVRFDSCINDLLQDFADSDGPRIGYFPRDGFHRHVVKVTVVRSPGSVTGWLVSTADPLPGDRGRASTCIVY